MMAEIPQLAMVMCEHGCVETMIYIMSNTDKDELHMRAAVCLRAMCSVDDDATKRLEEGEEEVVEEETSDKVEEVLEIDGEKMTKVRNSKIDGNPKLALNVLAGYEHTKHYDDMNSATKKELTEAADSSEQWYESLKIKIDESTKSLEEAKEKLFMEENTNDDDEEEEGGAASSVGVEIKILEDDDDGHQEEDTKGEEKKEEEKKEEEEKKKNSLKPARMKKVDRIKQVKKNVQELEKTLKECMEEIKEAENDTNMSKKTLEDWSPEIWKGGIGVLNAFTKIQQISEGTKGILTETLKLLSDRL